jgi:hypothetical protein
MEGGRATTDFNKCGGRFGGLLFLTLCLSSRNRFPLRLDKTDLPYRLQTVAASVAVFGITSMCGWSALALIFHPISKPAVNDLPLVVVARTEIEKFCPFIL